MKKTSLGFAVLILMISVVLLCFALTNDFIREIEPVKYSFIAIGAICILIGLYGLFRALK